MYLCRDFKIHQCLTVFLFVLLATLYSTTIPSSAYLLFIMFALVMSHLQNRPDIFNFSSVLYLFLPRFSSLRIESNYQMLLHNLSLAGSRS